MAWITIEIGFSMLLPGVTPVLVLLWEKIDYISAKVGVGNMLVLFVFLSIMVGLLLEFVRFSLERIEFDILPATVVKYLKKVFSSKKGGEKNSKTAKEISDFYKNEEAEAIKFWITYYYNRKKEDFKVKLKDKPDLNEFVEKEYSRPNISVGSDKWIILNLLQGESRRFLWEEYFIYYQASYNHMFSMLLSLGLYLLIYFLPQLRCKNLLPIDILKLSFPILIFISLGIFFGNTAFNWKIYIRKLAKKIILYSQIYS